MTVFGDEPHGNYNRILLSSACWPATTAVIPTVSALAGRDGVTLHAGVRVEEIDIAARTVRANGTVAGYDTLVMATGSQPLIPRIDGLVANGRVRDGVCVFRTMDDCDRILALARDSRRALIIGGGLLGLEAAR